MDDQPLFTKEEIDLIKEALWNYKFEVNKSSAKFHFRYLDGANKSFKDKSTLISNLLEKLKNGNV
jgi:hypothetical protein